MRRTLSLASINLNLLSSLFQIDLPGAGLPPTLTERAHLPADYPSTSPPVVEAI